MTARIANTGTPRRPGARRSLVSAAQLAGIGGFLAAMIGDDVAECPYAEDGSEWKGWLRGYLLAWRSLDNKCSAEATRPGDAVLRNRAPWTAAERWFVRIAWPTALKAPVIAAALRRQARAVRVEASRQGLSKERLSKAAVR